MLLVAVSGALTYAQSPAPEAKSAPANPEPPVDPPRSVTITITVDPAHAAEARAASVDVPNAITFDAAVKPAVVPGQIRSTSFEARDTLVATVKSQLITANQFMADLSLRAMPFSSDVRYQFQMVLNTARQRARQLGSTLQAVQTAIPGDFGLFRNRLAEDYAAYASAIAQLDAIVGANTSGPR